MNTRTLLLPALAIAVICSAGAYSADQAPQLAAEIDFADHQTELLPRGVHRQSAAEGLAEDLALVAKAKGWTIKQAAADRKMADVIGAIAAKLAVERPDIFVGSVLSEKPGGVPSLYIKGYADQAVYELLVAAPVDIDLVDRQPYSFDELEALKLQVHSTLADQGYQDIATSFDFQARVPIQALVTVQTKLPTLASEIAALLPATIRDSVAITLTTEPVGVDFYAYGGMAVQDDGVFECTAGWSVIRNGSNLTGITTAGHCNGINQIVHPGVGVHTAVHQNQHRGVWGDIEWKTTNATESAEFYASATTIRKVTSVEPRASISIGESICFYGRSSNQRFCQYDVSALSVSCTVSGVFNDRLVRMDGNSAIGGDSGGGWSWNNRAYGSVKGICGGGAVFSVADLYDEALGVRVRTQ